MVVEGLKYLILGMGIGSLLVISALIALKLAI
jgi:hypothetical protein